MPPIDLFSLSEGFMVTLGDPAAVESVYGEFMDAVLDSPLWSEERTDGVRIPWRLAKEASRSVPNGEVLGCPGLYLFGSAAGVPLYWGMTRQTLLRRLLGRYLRGSMSQCQLAADYEEALLARGLDGFPEKVRAAYRKVTPTGTVRLRHAVAFAQHGIDGIWLTVLPVRDVERIEALEEEVIAAAFGWNGARRYPPLLNRR